MKNQWVHCFTHQCSEHLKGGPHGKAKLRKGKKQFLFSNIGRHNSNHLLLRVTEKHIRHVILSTSKITLRCRDKGSEPARPFLGIWSFHSNPLFHPLSTCFCWAKMPVLAWRCVWKTANAVFAKSPYPWIASRYALHECNSLSGMRARFELCLVSPWWKIEMSQGLGCLLSLSSRTSVDEKMIIASKDRKAKNEL